MAAAVPSLCQPKVEMSERGVFFQRFCDMLCTLGSDSVDWNYNPVSVNMKAVMAFCVASLSKAEFGDQSVPLQRLGGGVASFVSNLIG